MYIISCTCRPKNIHVFWKTQRLRVYVQKFKFNQAYTNIYVLYKGKFDVHIPEKRYTENPGNVLSNQVKQTSNALWVKMHFVLCHHTTNPTPHCFSHFLQLEQQHSIHAAIIPSSRTSLVESPGYVCQVQVSFRSQWLQHTLLASNSSVHTCRNLIDVWCWADDPNSRSDRLSFHPFLILNQHVQDHRHSRIQLFSSESYAHHTSEKIMLKLRYALPNKNQRHVPRIIQDMENVSVQTLSKWFSKISDNFLHL